ncbi:conserved hypothetical protein [uncultured Pleomorphomonas sp.]|uniref:Uncharacterized protein n=1 Tax=uncultured Pleomorphomonas sp. TaxID=442121 RepID=A0A212LQC8_9HYPH|nr:hypothetical protein [uncultured Pleomorphomonas sp.]SCM79650.1 conserved hypothetical protein [uncultured Pleomorphomonas sp.]
MRVTAVRKGYFGGKIRDAGEVFDLPDALMRDGARPSWVEPEEGATASPAGPDEGGEPIARKRGRKPKPPSAPEPPEGNGLLEALGGPPPDWLPGDITE